MSYFLYISISIVVLYFIKKYFNGAKCKIFKYMNGKLVVITGSSAGIGKETAFELIKRGATVIFACRDEKKTSAVIEELGDPELVKRAIYINLDLCNVDSIKTFVTEFKKKFQTLDILINNAGTLEPKFSLTKDKLEKTLQSNHIGHMILTFMLLSMINKREGRIINLSSMLHARSNYSVENLKKLQENVFDFGSITGFDSIVTGYQIYSNSKMANVYFTLYLADILSKKNDIKAMSVHPGVVNTEFTRFMEVLPFGIRHITNFVITVFFPLFSKSSFMGAQTTLNLCYLNQKELVNGAYYSDCERQNLESKATDEEIRTEFIKYSWAIIDEITKGKIDVPKKLATE